MISGPITVSQLKDAEHTICRIVQNESFGNILKPLSNDRENYRRVVHKQVTDIDFRSHLLSLHSLRHFVASDHLLRVGGG